MNCNPRRCFLARFAIDTMEAAPSGCCMIDHTSSTTSRRGLGSWGRRRPHRLGADHRGGGPELRLQEVQVEDGDQGLVGQQVVALVGEEVAQAAGGEGPEQPGHVSPVRLVSLQVLIEVLEAGALPGLGVVARQGVVEGGAALRAETLADHHLDGRRRLPMR